jgi:hypothetical protein
VTNVLVAVGSIREFGKIFAPMDKTKIAMVDRRDVAAVAARTLTEDGRVDTAAPQRRPSMRNVGQDQLVDAPTWLCQPRGNAGQPRFSNRG